MLYSRRILRFLLNLLMSSLTGSLTLAQDIPNVRLPSPPNKGAK